MKVNIGNADRAIRIIGGIGVISLAYWGPHSQWGWLGIIPFITGIFGYSPLYAIFDINTKSTYAKKF